MFDYKTRYPIGIDITDHEIYATQFKKGKGGITLKGLFHRDLSVNGSKGQENQLLDLFKEISKNRLFSGKKVVAHLPPEYMISFPIRFELDGGEGLEQAIVRKTSEYLSFPIGEAVIDYPSIIEPSKSRPKEYRATVTLAKRSDIEKYLMQMKKAGFLVEAVDFVGCSLIRLHQYLYPPSENPCILCHIGHSQSILTAIHRDRILADRNFPWGIQTLIKKIITNLKLDGERFKARLLLKKFGLVSKSPGDSNKKPAAAEDESSDEIYRILYRIITPYMEELIEELHQMNGYLRSEDGGAAIEGIYVYGQGSFIKHLDKYLEGRINIPAELVNPITKSGMMEDGLVMDPTEGGAFALALGLAMRKVAWL